MKIKRVRYKINSFWPIAFVRVACKRLILPGFDGLSFYDVSIFFLKGLWQGSITTRAAALSFTFFLALFPAIIFFFTLIPYIPIDGFQDTLLVMLQNVLPKAAYENALTTIIDIVKRQHGSLLSFGFIAALYFSTSGISAIMIAFNESVHIKETRTVLKQKLIAILLVFILSILTVVAIALIIAGSSLLNHLMKSGYLQSNFTYYALMIGKWIIAIALFFFVISFLYYLAPSKHSRFRFISAGSTLATMLFILSSIGFNFYISHFATYNKLYGSIGALIIILVWIYINAMVLLIGFELNASLRSARARNKIIISTPVKKIFPS